VVRGERCGSRHDGARSRSRHGPRGPGSAFGAITESFIPPNGISSRMGRGLVDQHAQLEPLRDGEPAIELLHRRVMPMDAPAPGCSASCRRWRRSLARRDRRRSSSSWRRARSERACSIHPHAGAFGAMFVVRAEMFVWPW
jgi:hypothetical protein